MTDNTKDPVRVLLDELFNGLKKVNRVHDVEHLLHQVIAIKAAAIPHSEQRETAAAGEVHQWRRKYEGSSWQDASKEDAYSRVDEYYEARTLYAVPVAAPVPEAPTEELYPGHVRIVDDRAAPVPEAKAEQVGDTPESMAASNARFAIDGAIQYGRENRNAPPGAEHWLYEYWNIGRQLATLGATGWDNVTPMAAPAVKHEASEDETAAFFKWWHSNDYEGCGPAQLGWMARAALAAPPIAVQGSGDAK